MRFWDTSALVPLLLQETSSDRMERLHDDVPGLVVWWGSLVEAVSAISRSERLGTITREVAVFGLGMLSALREGAFEIQPSEEVRARASRIVSVHPLRAADAFQLGSALVWCQERTAGVGFVSLDNRLREAALREGFEVLPAENPT